LNDVLKNTNEYSSSNPIYEDNSWHSINKKQSLNRNYTNSFNNNIPLTNRFDALTDEDNFNALNDRIYNDDANIITNSQTAYNKSTVGLVAGSNFNLSNNRRPQVVVQNLDEPPHKTIPGNSSYADLTKRGKKICMFGDSLLQPINMKEFNSYLDNKQATRVSFPGATASKLCHYTKPTIEEELPDTVLINIGTNNITKTQQSENEIVDEIMEIVKQCRKMGVNNILVAGLTVRKRFEKKIDAINKLLKHNATFFKFKYIDNSNIRNHHLNNDGLHLQIKGTIILARNFLNALNYTSPYDPFY
jgi:hypothetical protein